MQLCRTCFLSYTPLRQQSPWLVHRTLSPLPISYYLTDRSQHYASLIVYCRHPKTHKSQSAEFANFSLMFIHYFTFEKFSSQSIGYKFFRGNHVLLLLVAYLPISMLKNTIRVKTTATVQSNAFGYVTSNMP